MLRDAYREGYLERPDRKQRFESNLDMEALHSLTPEEGIRFLDDFFHSNDKENYYLATSKEGLAAKLVEVETQ